MKYLSFFFQFIRDLWSKPIGYCMECGKKIYSADDFDFDSNGRFSTVARRSQSLIHDSPKNIYCKSCFAFLSETYIAEKYITLKGW